MRKITGLICAVCFLGLAASCSEEVKSCAGRINSLNDSLMVMQIGEYEVNVNLSQARLTNGAIMPGDSVNVDYQGDLRKKSVKALLISLIPPQGTYVDAGVDTTRELQTTPMTDEEVRASQEFFEMQK